MIEARECLYHQGFAQNFTPLGHDIQAWSSYRDGPGPMPRVTLALFEAGFDKPNGIFNAYGPWAHERMGQHRTRRNRLRINHLEAVGRRRNFRAFITLANPNVPDHEKVLRSWFVEDFQLRIDSLDPQTGEYRATVVSHDSMELWDWLTGIREIIGR